MRLAFPAAGGTAGRRPEPMGNGDPTARACGEAALGPKGLRSMDSTPPASFMGFPLPLDEAVPIYSSFCVCWELPLCAGSHSEPRLERFQSLCALFSSVKGGIYFHPGDEDLSVHPKKQRPLLGAPAPWGPRRGKCRLASAVPGYSNSGTAVGRRMLEARRGA
jgi:hypothetical protein